MLSVDESLQSAGVGGARVSRGRGTEEDQIGHAAVKVIWTTKSSWPFQIHYLHLYTSFVYGAHAEETE